MAKHLYTYNVYCVLYRQLIQTFQRVIMTKHIKIMIVDTQRILIVYLFKF